MIKKINIKGFLRKVGGKQVRVKPSFRKLVTKAKTTKLVDSAKNAGLISKRFKDLTSDWKQSRFNLFEQQKAKFGLTDSEAKSLALYVGNDDYLAINGFLRGEKFIEGSDISPKTAEAISIELSSALKKLPPIKNRSTLYRSENLDFDDALKMYKEGKVVTNNFFTSTSYVESSIPSNSVQVEITPAPKSKGRNVSQFGLSDRKQYEVLFDKNSKFRVKKVEKIAGASIPSNYQIAKDWGDIEIFRPIFEDGGEKALLNQYGIKNGSHADFIRNPRNPKYKEILKDFYPTTILRVVLSEL